MSGAQALEVAIIGRQVGLVRVDKPIVTRHSVTGTNVTA
jgi:hypothetical protein